MEERLADVVQALEDAGYSPIEQIQGYLQTGDKTFITRRNNARSLVEGIDRRLLIDYVRKTSAD